MESIASSRTEEEEMSEEIAMEVMDSNILGAKILEWVAKVDECRKNSGNIQGKISGQMKRKLRRIKEATITLVERTKATADQLKDENISLARSNEILRKENARLRTCIREKENIGETSTEENTYQNTNRKKENNRGANRTSSRLADRLENARRTQIQEEGRDAIVERLVEEMERLKTAIMSLKEGQRMPPPTTTIMLGNKKTYNKEKGSYANALRRQENEREKPRTTTTTKRRQRRTSERYRRNDREGTRTDTRTETQGETSSAGWTEVRRKNRIKRNTRDRSRQMIIRDRELPKRRTPRTAAITLKKEEGIESYAQMLRKAREKISLTEMDINNTKIRHAITGSLIIEVAGPDNNNKADKLAEKLRTVLAGEATIARPVKTGEMLMRGIDSSITADEMIKEICEIGGCEKEQIKLGTLKVMRNGLGTVWVRCPIEAAIRITENGPLRLGWTRARLELLKARKLQCYRCMEFGHVVAVCKSEI